MKEFDNWYRRHPRMNLTGCGRPAWKKAKERDREIWRAALEWVLGLEGTNFDYGHSHGRIDIEVIEEELNAKT